MAAEAPSGATVAAARMPRWLWLYGAVIAVLGTLALTFVTDASITSTRVDGIAQSLAVLDAGGPPLLGREGGEEFPLGTTDDQGLYLWAPLLGQVTGQDDPAILTKWMYLLLFALPIALAPVVFFGLFGSLRAALAAPLAYVVLIASLGIWDVYSAVAWAIITLLPLVLYAHERWPRHTLALLVAVALGASFANTLRAQAGLPVVLAALAVLFIRAPWSRGRQALAAVLVVAAYLVFTPLGLGVVRDYRDAEANDPNLAEGHPTSHPVWHNAYIGLGYLENRWRIQWSDGDAAAAVKLREPDAPFLSRTYLDTARDLYFDTARADIGFYLETMAAKAAVAIRHLARFWFFAFLLLPLLLIAGPRRAQMRRWTLYVLPALAIAVPSVLAALPDRAYEMGLHAGLGLLVVLAGAAVLDPLVDWLRGPRRGAAVAALMRSRGGRLAAAISVTGILVFGVISVIAGPIQDDARAWLTKPIQPPLEP